MKHLNYLKKDVKEMKSDIIKKFWLELMNETRKAIEEAKLSIDDSEYKDIIYEIEQIEKEANKEKIDIKILELRGNILGHLGGKL